MWSKIAQNTDAQKNVELARTAFKEKKISQLEVLQAEEAFNVFEKKKLRLLYHFELVRIVLAQAIGQDVILWSENPKIKGSD